MRRVSHLAALGAALALPACASDQSKTAIQIVPQRVTVEVQRPCDVTKPVRPAPLARPLPTDAVALAALALAKLAEWSGPGGFGDRADAAIDVCAKP